MGGVTADFFENVLGMGVDSRPRIGLIYRNETFANPGGAPEARRSAPADGGDAPGLAAGADHPQPRPRMYQMRERRRPSAVRSHGELSGRTHAAVQSTQRAGSSGAALARQLSGSESGHRGHLRAQS